MAVRKVLNLLLFFIRALKGLKTTMFVVAFLVLGFCRGSNVTCNVTSYSPYNMSNCHKSHSPRVYVADLANFVKSNPLS